MVPPLAVLVIYISQTRNEDTILKSLMIDMHFRIIFD